MAKKQDVKGEVGKKLKSKELENVSAGRTIEIEHVAGYIIEHAKDKLGEDLWFIVPEELYDHTGTSFFRRFIII